MVTITPAEASGPGSLPHFRLACGECGMTWGNTLHTSASLEAHAHKAWHTRKAAEAAKPRRRSR